MPPAAGDPRPNSRQVFRPGAAVRLDYRDGSGATYSWETRVVRWGPETLFLDAPVHQGVAVAIATGTEVTLWAHRQPDTYAAACRVVAVHPGEPELLETTAPQRLEQRSQRRFYRVATDLAAETSLGAAVVVDLSGGGCSLFFAAEQVGAGRPTPPDTPLALTIALPDDGGEVRVRARPVRTWRTAGGRRVAVEFTGVDDRVQERIVRYVFRRQRQLLRRARSDRA